MDSVADGAAVPGLVVYRFDGPLFFANAQLLADDIEAAVAEGAAPEPVRWVVIDAESIGDVDSTGAGMLADLADEPPRARDHAGPGAPQGRRSRRTWTAPA